MLFQLCNSLIETITVFIGCHHDQLCIQGQYQHPSVNLL